MDSTIKGRREFELGKLCEQVEKAWDGYPEDKLVRCMRIFQMKKRVLEEIDSVVATSMSFRTSLIALLLIFQRLKRQKITYTYSISLAKLHAAELM